jgi:hypothetical protein
MTVVNRCVASYLVGYGCHRQGVGIRAWLTKVYLFQRTQKMALHRRDFVRVRLHLSI